MWVVGATTATRETSPSESIRWAMWSPKVVLPAAGVADARNASPVWSSTAAAAACCQARRGRVVGQAGRERPARTGASIWNVTGRAKLVRVSDEKRRQVPIAERGPGWSYRPETDPGERQPGVSTAHLRYALLAAYDGDPRELIEEASQRPETVTIGFGATAFSDRHRPIRLKPLPPFPGDDLRPELGGGDLCVLLCSDDAPP